MAHLLLSFFRGFQKSTDSIVDDLPLSNSLLWGYHNVLLCHDQRPADQNEHFPTVLMQVWPKTSRKSSQTYCLVLSACRYRMDMRVGTGCMSTGPSKKKRNEDQQEDNRDDRAGLFFHAGIRVLTWKMNLPALKEALCRWMISQSRIG
jgi:hypothetical protein